MLSRISVVKGRFAALVAMCFCLGLLAIGQGANAQTPTPPSVPVVDYGTAATTVITSVGSTVTTLFPYLGVLIALFAGIAIFKRMIKSGAKG